MVNGPAVPVARTVKLPSQIVASVLPVGERMEISAERGMFSKSKIMTENSFMVFYLDVKHLTLKVRLPH